MKDIIHAIKCDPLEYLFPITVCVFLLGMSSYLVGYSVMQVVFAIMRLF